MTLKRIVFCSLNRRKGRFILLVIGLSIGISAFSLLFILSQVMTENLRNTLDRLGPNMLITPKSDSIDLYYEGFNFGNVNLKGDKLSVSDLSALKRIKNSKNIAIVAPRLLRVAEVRRQSVLVAGVEFDKELELNKWWKPAPTLTSAGQFTATHRHWKSQEEELSPPSGEKHSLIGFNLAGRLGVRRGGTLNIAGEDFVIDNVLAPTGSSDDETLFIPLATAQRIFQAGDEISLAGVSALCKGCPIDDIVQQINDAMPNARATALTTVVIQRAEFMSRFQKFAFGIGIITLAIGAILVFVTIMASVNERAREIGLMRAIGFRESHVAKMILSESFIVSIIAGVSGYITGVVVGLLVVPTIAGSGVGNFFLLALTFSISLVVSVLIGAVGSIHPALRASRMDPCEALRAI